MRLLHPTTIKTITVSVKLSEFNNATISKRSVLSHAWSEVLKYMATKQNHPKMFIDEEHTLGYYMRLLYDMGTSVGCNMNATHLTKYDDLYYGFCTFHHTDDLPELMSYFDDNYLFSDCVSLYFKGFNLFKHVYGYEWRKLVPVESLKEIKRQVDKTLSK